MGCRTAACWRRTTRAGHEDFQLSTVGAIGAGAMDLFAERRLGQVEIAGRGADALALLEDQADRLRFEVVIEPSAWAPAPFRRLCHRCGHRIRLSESVHETGSIPAVCQSLLADLQNRGLRADRSLLVILDGSNALQGGDSDVRSGHADAALPSPDLRQALTKRQHRMRFRHDAYGSISVGVMSLK